MANYAPPSEDVAIFNGGYFTGIPLTTQIGDGRYLKLLAQGDEDMNDNDILNINQADLNSVKFSDNTIQTTAFTGGGADTLADTLLAGNSAGATDIDMNNQNITNATAITTGTLNYTTLNPPIPVVSGTLPGTIITFAGNSIPSGYILCDGGDLVVANEPDLFAVIGITYGSSGTGLFSTPNLLQKFIMGASTSSGISGGTNSQLVQASNISAFTPTQVGQTSVVFNSSSGIPDWAYIKGKPMGDSSYDMWLPYATNDNRNGTNLVDALNIGTGTTQLDNRPEHYLMIYCIKT